MQKRGFLRTSYCNKDRTRHTCRPGWLHMQLLHVMTAESWEPKVLSLQPNTEAKTTPLNECIPCHSELASLLVCTANVNARVSASSNRRWPWASVCAPEQSLSVNAAAVMCADIDLITVRLTYREAAAVSTWSAQCSTHTTCLIKSEQQESDNKCFHIPEYPETVQTLRLHLYLYDPESLPKSGKIIPFLVNDQLKLMVVNGWCVPLPPCFIIRSQVWLNRLDQSDAHERQHFILNKNVFSLDEKNSLTLCEESRRGQQQPHTHHSTAMIGYSSYFSDNTSRSELFNILSFGPKTFEKNQL